MLKRSKILVAGIGIAVVALVLLALGVRWPGGEKDATGLAPLDPAELSRGASVYAANCASCHGVSGEGQPNWQQRGPHGTLPPPPHDATGHTWHHADGLLYRTIRDGGAQFAGPTTPSGMPGFGDQLSDEEIRAVIALLKSFWGEADRAFQAQVSASDPLP